MMNEQFLNLKQHKKDKIILESLKEFSLKGYENASTNTIVTNCEISKGSLFKYFNNKEDLYFYVLDIVIHEQLNYFESKIDYISKDLFERIIKYSELEFSWYLDNPLKYKLIVQAFTKNNHEIYPKIINRYQHKMQSIYYDLLKDIDVKNFRWSSEKTFEILKWVLNGFNDEFRNNLMIDEIEIEKVKQDYVTRLYEQLMILKGGIVK